MKLRWLKITVIGLLTAIIMLAAAAFTVVRTETGAGWVLGIAQDRLDGLEIGSHSGSIHGGLELQRIGFSTPAFVLQADSLHIAVRTEWFPFVLRIERLEADSLEYRVLDTEDGTEAEPLPEAVELPFPLELPRIRLSGIRLLDQQGVEIFAANSLIAAASVDREVLLHELEVAAEGGTLSLDGKVALQNPFPMSLALQAGLVIAIEEELEPLVVNLAMNANGTVSALDLEVDGTADPPGFEAHAFEVASRVTQAGMELSQITIDGTDLQASGTGEVDWKESWARLENIILEIPGTALRITARLATDLESGDLEGHITWTELTWPLRTEVPEWISPKGSVRLSGSVDNWSAAGQLEVQATGYPAGQARFRADGDRGGVQVSIPEMTVLGGQLQGTGSYRWDDDGAFTAEVGLEDLSTESVLPEYPAVLGGELAASGRMEPLSVSLDVRSLSGVALGKPVAASGRLELAGGTISADEFNIESGASHVVLNGFPDQQNGLAFDADITDLGDFLPGGRGAVAATGSLYLRSGWPALSLDASGTGIGWQDYDVAEMTVSGSNQDSAKGANGFAVSLLETRIGETVLEQANVQLMLEPDRQALSLNARSGLNELVMDLAGRLDQPEQSPESEGWNWTGQLENLHAVLNGKDQITLQEPAPLRLSSVSASLDSACMLGSRGATICLEGEWSVDGGAELDTRFGQVPLDVLNELLGMDLRLSQMFSGEMQMLFPASGKPSGSAGFVISAGTISYADDPDPILETGEGALGFTMADGRLNSGVLDIPITGQGMIDIDFNIPDVTAGLDAKIVGTLLIDLADLDVLSVVLPMTDQVSGTLRTDLKMSGTLRQPYFNGRLDLREGLLVNRASGLKLEDIELSGNLVGNGETQLTGTFRAAEGVGELKARIDLRDIQQPQFELGVSGDQLKVFDSEDLMIIIDTDLNVAFQPGSVTIDGKVNVPRAHIAPAVIPEQTVSESTDLVITAGRPSGETAEKEEIQPVSIFGGLEFSLGDEVTLDLTVAELDLAGKVDFNWQGNPMPLANGNLSMDGEIVALGQRLAIAQGDIRFPGRPADNPHLNIRAEREIYGNSEVRRAGLLIAGTLQRPVVEPYTVPMTNRDRAQTLLVTGSDFNMERGVGAVDIGTYIAPRIFVSYGVGVFDDSNIIAIRYDLGRGWGVKATSGERQTGLDISYTIEK